MSEEFEFLCSIRDGNYHYLKDVMEAIYTRIEYLNKRDVNSEEKVPTHKEFQKAVDKSGLRGHKFAISEEVAK